MKRTLVWVIGLLAKLIILIALLALLATPLWAQQASETPTPGGKAFPTSDCPTDAQAWYDQIDPQDHALPDYKVIITQATSVTDRQTAQQDVEDILKAVEALPYPDCVEQARQWYGEALRELLTGANLYNASLSNFLLIAWSSAATEKIGQFRGYLSALGVEIEEDTTAPFPTAPFRMR